MVDVILTAPTAPDPTNQTSHDDFASLHPPSISNESVVMMKPLVCPRDSVALPFIEADRYEKIMLRQCTTSRFGIRPPPLR